MVRVLNVFGDDLEIRYEHPMWVAPSCGSRHPRAVDVTLMPGGATYRVRVERCDEDRDLGRSPTFDVLVSCVPDAPGEYRGPRLTGERLRADQLRHFAAAASAIIAPAIGDAIRSAAEWKGGAS